MGNCGSAPTRIDTESSSSNHVVRCWATIEMNPGARPHCGMKIWPSAACAAIAATGRVVATSSVRSK